MSADSCISSNNLAEFNLELKQNKRVELIIDEQQFDSGHWSPKWLHILSVTLQVCPWFVMRQIK